MTKATDKSEVSTPMRATINYTLDGKPLKLYVGCDSFTDDDAFKAMLKAHDAKAKFVSAKKYKPRKTAAKNPEIDTPDLPAIREAKEWLDEITKLAPLLAMIPKLSPKALDAIAWEIGNNQRLSECEWMIINKKVSTT